MVHQIKLAYLLLIVCVLYVSVEKVSAKPEANNLQEAELMTATLSRQKRQWEVVPDVFKWAKTAVENGSECAERGGCHKGYCWAYCGLSLRSADWCYTTKTYSQSFEYVTCTSDSECDLCWKCAGSCTL